MIKLPEAIGFIEGHTDVAANIKENTVIEKSVVKILKLIKSKDRPKKGGASKDSKRIELIGLIEDLHEQHQILYGLYDHLRLTSIKKARGSKGKETSTSSISSSDSDYYSSEDIDNIRNNLENEQQKSAIAHMEESSTSTLKLEYVEALRKKEEVEALNKRLRNTADQRERELSGRVKELEGQLADLKKEVGSLCGEKKDLEAQVEFKNAETEQLKEKNTVLYTRVSELESISGSLEEKRKNEASLTSKSKELAAEISKMQQELDSLCAQKLKLQERNEELDSLRRQNLALTLELERKTREVSENMHRIVALKEELARKSLAEERIVEEKDNNPLVLGEVLDDEVDHLRHQKSDLEEQIRSKVHDINQLREEKEKLHDRIFELEGMLTNRGREFFSLQKKYESNENEASTQIMALSTQVNCLKHEFGTLQSLKSDLEMQNKRLKQEFSQNHTLLETENTKLTSKIDDQQRIIKDQEDAMKKLTDEYKQAKRQSIDSKLRLQAAERKMEELAEEFRKKMEDHIRLLYQRIVVAEQIHTENKVNYRKAKERLEEENKVLEEKIAAYEPELWKMWDMLKPGNNALTALDLALRKFHNDNGNALERISKISNEIQSAKNWVSVTNNEMKRLKHNMNNLTSQLDGKEEHELLLREKVWSLEAKLGKEGGEKLNLVKATNQLERKVRELEKKITEKDDKLFGLGEEKREAIRQLCILNDYHRSRCDQLKEVIIKINGRRKRTI